MKLPEKECECGTVFTQFNSLNRFCSYTCKARYSKKQDKKPPKTPKPIRKFSEKRTVQELQYKSDRIIFLAKPENQVCPITGQQTTEIHHVRKRRGFADEWARLNNVPLLLDQRFWLAVSRSGHVKIEDNPEWAYEKGYSIKNNQ